MVARFRAEGHLDLRKAAIIKRGAIERNDRYRVTEEIRTRLAFLDAIISKGILPSDISAGLKGAGKDSARFCRRP